MLDALQVPTRLVVVGNSPSWTTPIAIIVVIVFVILWILARLKSADDARKRRAAEQAGHDIGAFQGEGFEGHSAHADASDAAPVAGEISAPDREAAWRALFVPDTSAERLAEIAAAYPEFAAQLAQHPNAYPDLRAWAAEQQQQ